jgi:hypothetical protein
VRDTFLRHKSLKWLEVGSLALFGLLALVTRLPQFNPSIVAVRLWVDASLLVIIAADAAMLYVPEFTPILGTVVIVAVLAGAAFLTAWLPKTASRRAS